MTRLTLASSLVSWCRRGPLPHTTASLFFPQIAQVYSRRDSSVCPAWLPGTAPGPYGEALVSVWVITPHPKKVLRYHSFPTETLLTLNNPLRTSANLKENTPSCFPSRPRDRSSWPGRCHVTFPNYFAAQACSVSHSMEYIWALTYSWVW